MCFFFFFFLRWCLLFLSMLRSCSSFLPSPKAPGNQSVFCLYRYCISMVSYDRGTFCLAFSFSILYSKFICFVVYVRTSFLFMANNILLYIYIIIYPFISWWIFGLFPSFDCCELCCYNICVHTFVLVPVFSSFGCIYQGVKMLGHMLILCLTLLGTTKLFFTVTESFYILTTSVFSLIWILLNLCIHIQPMMLFGKTKLPIDILLLSSSVRSYIIDEQVLF